MFTNLERQEIMRIRTWIIAAAACTGLVACGETLGEQAIGGGVTGGAIAAVTGESVGTGALVGAAGNIAYCRTYPSKCR